MNISSDIKTSLDKRALSVSPAASPATETPGLLSLRSGIEFRSRVVTDPLREYVSDLTEKVHDPRYQASLPIASGTATTHGTRTLSQFAVLKERERLGILHESEAEYARYGTPITRRVESALAALDGGEMALVFRSGMAAIEKVLDSILPVSREVGHIIVFQEGYRQTNNILARMAARGHVELSMIPLEGFQELHGYIKPNTKAIFFETPSNPFLRTIDVRSVKNQVEEAGSDALVVVDHTFGTPLNQLPLQQGADLVVPSLTKYISGNNQVLAGAVVGRKDLVERIAQLRSQSGNIAHDNDCLGIEEGLTTLRERVERANENGLHVANLLARNPNVLELWYPGHPSHPDYEIAKGQMTGCGGVVSFRLNARDFYDVEAFTDAFIEASPQGAFIAPSFGGEYPLLSAVTVVSHFQQSQQERAARGIAFDLMRLSVGTGNPQQLTDALAAGFAALESRKP